MDAFTVSGYGEEGVLGRSNMDRSPGRPGMRGDGPTALGNVLRQERVRLGLSQQQLADRIGATQPEIARWEAGRSGEMRLRTLERLAEAGIDRVMLGLAEVTLEKVRADIDAARDETLLLGKPLTALAVLAPSLRWMENRWRQHRLGDRRLDQAELHLLVNARLMAALIGTLAFGVRRQDWIMRQLEHAEYAAHRLVDDSHRLDSLSSIYVLSGNQLRKAERYEDAIHLLSIAERLAGDAARWRRQDEAAGLLAYAYGNSGQRAAADKALSRAEESLGRAPSEIGLSTDDAADQSMFVAASVDEIRLRCAILAKDKHRLRALSRNPVIPTDTNFHWRMYYSTTIGIALLALHDSDGVTWLEQARALAVEKLVPDQLQRMLPAVSRVDCADGRALSATVNDDLRRMVERTTVIRI
jgi:transcriptional regulator with XRE-family HTH domain